MSQHMVNVIVETIYTWKRFVQEIQHNATTVSDNKILKR